MLIWGGLNTIFWLSSPQPQVFEVANSGNMSDNKYMLA